MPSAEEKKRRQELAQQAKAAATASLVAGMPLNLSQLKKLFDYLDGQLSVGDCDHTLRYVKQFATDAQLPYESLKAWLATLGGYCDCEVLANVEEKFEGLI